MADLDAFVSESLDRPGIIEFLREAAAEMDPGARVLDAGSGEAPYAQLFAHCDYVTADWPYSMHAGAEQADVVASLDDLPLADASFDGVVSTQVLEHVEHPEAVLAELRRVLAPGGRLWLTAPFVGELHEEPFDFYRYTPYALRSLLQDAGFESVDVQPIGGYFTTLGQLLRNYGGITGSEGEGHGLGGRLVASAFWRIGPVLRRFDRLDKRRALPLGYKCRATARSPENRGA